MSTITPQEQTVLLQDLLSASKSAERLIAALFEIGALDGEPFLSTWCQLDKTIDRTQRALSPPRGVSTSRRLIGCNVLNWALTLSTNWCSIRGEALSPTSKRIQSAT